MRRILAGFIAGFLAVLIFHQGMYLVMKAFMGIPLSGEPWRMAAGPLWPELFRAFKMAPVSLPIVINQSIWGGVWGVLFVLLMDRMPGGITLIKAFVFAMIFPMLLGSWVLLPLVKGGALFSGAFGKGGFNHMALRNGFLLNGVGYGIGLGLLYPIIRRMLIRS